MTPRISLEMRAADNRNKELWLKDLEYCKAHDYTPPAFVDYEVVFQMHVKDATDDDALTLLSLIDPSLGTDGSDDSGTRTWEVTSLEDWDTLVKLANHEETEDGKISSGCTITLPGTHATPKRHAVRKHKRTVRGVTTTVKAHQRGKRVLKAKQAAA